ncbi:transcriptional regulator [Methylobacterium sp. J-070]|uniref:transcriptional regulator n=1 Tax=Methylobacterium sp. J-070 TaxID=2836650 RepID=UPI001FB8F61F|nr:transcriptional regulator [Methylobacterium sp. J-070]MCJ2050869.1 transcriptional regulator [Methylobacterium sp. J-070]
MTAPAKVTATEKAAAAWGPALPDEVRALALHVDRTTGAAAAKAIGYSPAVVSHILAARYPGDQRAVFARIRGALMGETVLCPVLGEIGRDRCLSEQKKPFATSNAARARLYRACRSGCPHSWLKGA